MSKPTYQDLEKVFCLKPIDYRGNYSRLCILLKGHGDDCDDYNVDEIFDCLQEDINQIKRDNENK